MCNIILLLLLKILTLIVSDVGVELPHKLLSLLCTLFPLLTLLTVADDDDYAVGDDDGDADDEVVVDGRSTRAVHVICNEHQFLTTGTLPAICVCVCR